MEWLDALNRFLDHQGAVKGLLILAVAFLWWRNHRQHEARLADKESEIKRLAADVHDMRARMMALWDAKAGLAGGMQRGRTDG